MDRLFNESHYMNEETKLFYAISYRNFDFAIKVIERNKFQLDDDNIQKLKINNVGIEDIILWNLDYLEQFDKRSESLIKLTEWAGKLINKTSDNKFTYDEVVMEDKSVFDLLFTRQPLLGIDYVKGQDLPSKQVEENGASLVLDEVGSGKSVEAMYAIANTIDDTKKRKSRILIVAPSPLMEKWQHDILRQLGRYSHIVSRGDLNEQYVGELKSIYFMDKEHCIFIIDNIAIKNKTSMHMWWKDKEPWDLVIIDESHLCNGNYYSIRANKVMLLTATPIVVASNKKDIELSTYKELMETITGQDYSHQEIAPIDERNPNEKNIFVNRFREAFGQMPCKRNISFYKCIRNENWYEYYKEIELEKHTLASLHYAQDDDYLVSKYNQLRKKNIINKFNGKIIMLKYILGLTLRESEKKHLPSECQNVNEVRKSYIIFCEHQEVIDNIYDSLKQVDANLIVAKKYANIEVFDEGKCEAGTLIPQLNQQIKDGKQTILITTGQTGGTGLNLGYFDGVIHYELPYTSVQLEQRYGRVDRMDTRVSDEKDMIFLLNACDKKDFFNHNAMLYYCVSKIDRTCKYIPIRNTVLFYPKLIDQIVEHLIEVLQNLQKDELFQNSMAMRDLNASIKEYKGLISNLLNYKISTKEDWEELIKEKDSIGKGEISRYLNRLHPLIEKKKCYLVTINEYERIKQIAQNIYQILFNASLSDDVFISQDVSSEEDELKSLAGELEFKNIIKTEPDNFDSPDSSLENNEKDWSDDIKILMENLLKIDSNNLVGEGVFYRKDKQLVKEILTIA